MKNSNIFALPLSSEFRVRSREYPVERTEILRGGDRVRISPLSEEDIAAERQLAGGLSTAARRALLFSYAQLSNEGLLRPLTINATTNVIFVAVIDDRTRTHEIGVGRFSSQAGATECEFALTVSDKWQQKGIGSRLMQRLSQTACDRGMRRMYSSEPNENLKMHRFALHLNLTQTPDPTDFQNSIYSVDFPEQKPKPAFLPTRGKSS